MDYGWKIAEETLRLYFNEFLKYIIEIYGAIYPSIWIEDIRKEN